MKLRIIGSGDQGGDIARCALKQGFTVLHLPATECTYESMLDTDAVVWLPDESNGIIRDSHVIDILKDTSVRRLLVCTATDNLSTYDAINSLLQHTSVDWTAVNHIDSLTTDSKSTLHDFVVSAKDVARFIVSQVTDTRYLHTTVLLQN